MRCGPPRLLRPGAHLGHTSVGWSDADPLATSRIHCVYTLSYLDDANLCFRCACQACGFVGRCSKFDMIVVFWTTPTFVSAAPAKLVVSLGAAQNLTCSRNISQMVKNWVIMHYVLCHSAYSSLMLYPTYDCCILDDANLCFRCACQACGFIGRCSKFDMVDIELSQMRVVLLRRDVLLNSCAIDWGSMTY
ncbi:uncharacterized protein LOC110434304 isoform X2 [Sorghum bicolor]|uniref:uncharacterized protein LOC110434304 isoform X2 n=1 Tax=Sorghum bicolor TaxID=4558 RepID=UPI000B424347|nr:uncharacterized protein LOC110434304 isoform X2 [Sorghum bicolor]|eukprot:XP_021313817.1 uncharacterized protein LOC110434304 isoform X2 [Sorghum bicolor]